MKTRVTSLPVNNALTASIDQDRSRRSPSSPSAGHTVRTYTFPTDGYRSNHSIWATQKRGKRKERKLEHFSSEEETRGLPVNLVWIPESRRWAEVSWNSPDLVLNRSSAEFRFSPAFRGQHSRSANIKVAFHRSTLTASTWRQWRGSAFSGGNAGRGARTIDIEWRPAGWRKSLWWADRGSARSHSIPRTAPVWTRVRRPGSATNRSLKFIVKCFPVRRLLYSRLAFFSLPTRIPSHSLFNNLPCARARSVRVHFRRRSRRRAARGSAELPFSTGTADLSRMKRFH